MTKEKAYLKIFKDKNLYPYIVNIVTKKYDSKGIQKCIACNKEKCQNCLLPRDDK